MKRLIATLAGATLLVLIASCGGETSQEEPPEDVEAPVEQALATMDGLNSYRLEMGFGPGEAPPIVIEFASPNSYRFQWGVVQTTDGSESPKGVFETIIVGDKAYTRQCERPDKNCEDWKQGPRPAVPIAGPSPSFLPQWPLVAIEMAGDLETLGTEKVDGEVLLRVRGLVNHLRAILENERRVFTAAGITSFGEECEQEAAVPVSGTPIQGEEVCRELTYEEALENQEPTLSFYDQNPATIDIWLSPDDSLVHRIRLDIPPHDDPYAASGDSGEAVVTIDYSRFNEISIEAP